MNDVIDWMINVNPDCTLVIIVLNPLNDDVAFTIADPNDAN